MSVIRVVIVEDEALQARQLEVWLKQEQGVEIVGTADNGNAAIQLIDSLHPDLVLLDVSLPECSGLEVLARIEHAPAVVFTTAFRDHAVEAFELGAVDYLLKPFGRDRLVAALDRVRAGERHRDSDRAEASTAQRVALVSDDGKPLERLFVRERNSIVPVQVEHIVRLEADGDYTAVLTADKRYLVAVSLSALHERIRNADFVRVHRQHVVNMAHVARLVPYDATRLQVEFRKGGSIVASRSGSQELRGMAE